MPPTKTLHGVVVSAGLMQKTVKVRTSEQAWDKHIRKHFTRPVHHLVHDPASSLLAGDIISFTSGYRTSKRVHHVVTAIVAPFEKPLDARPPVWTAEQRDMHREQKRAAKMDRRATRRSSSVDDGEESVKPSERNSRIVSEVQQLRAKAVQNESENPGNEEQAQSVDERIRRGFV